ncbi:DUF1730 domain-containing protein [Akkermansia muciniphila]|nr:DUF1730 domain-containing protein [Akkermansia muciniphila]
MSRQLGFSGCRVARAEKSPHAEKLFQWLERGWHAGMEWMARSPERRTDPAEVLPGCRSVICLSYDYDSPGRRPEREGSICLYAHGKDYHGILEEKLADLQELLSIYGGKQKGYVDSGPVMERDHAEACGLGWRGKSGLIVRRKGAPAFYRYPADYAGTGTGRSGFKRMRQLPPLCGPVSDGRNYGKRSG